MWLKQTFLVMKCQEKVLITCIAWITIDSVMKMKKNNYAQGYLEERKYKIKRTKMSEFINPELKSNTSPDSE